MGLSLLAWTTRSRALGNARSEQKELDHEAYLRCSTRSDFGRRVGAGIGRRRARWWWWWRHAWRRFPWPGAEGAGAEVARAQYAKPDSGPAPSTGAGARHQWTAFAQRDAGDGERALVASGGARRPNRIHRVVAFSRCVQRRLNGINGWPCRSPCTHLANSFTIVGE